MQKEQECSIKVCASRKLGATEYIPQIVFRDKIFIKSKYGNYKTSEEAVDSARKELRDLLGIDLTNPKQVEHHLCPNLVGHPGNFRFELRHNTLSSVYIYATKKTCQFALDCFLRELLKLQQNEKEITFQEMVF